MPEKAKCFYPEKIITRKCQKNPDNSFTIYLQEMRLFRVRLLRNKYLLALYLPGEEQVIFS